MIQRFRRTRTGRQTGSLCRFRVVKRLLRGQIAYLRTGLTVSYNLQRYAVLLLRSLLIENAPYGRLTLRMNRYFIFLVPLLFLVGLILAAPALIGALPDRYVYRLPEPIQKYGLPQEGPALLPTVSAPAAAVSLLSTATESVQQAAASPTVAATPTLKPMMVGDKPVPASATDISPEAANQTEGALPATQIAAETAAPTATQTPRPWPLPGQVRLEGFQHKFQTWNNCGPATLAMGLTYFDEAVSKEQTASVLKPNTEDRNVSPEEMADYVN